MGGPITTLKLDECPNCQSKDIHCLGDEVIDEFRVEDLLCGECHCEWDQDIHIKTNEFNGSGSYVNYP